jgi:glycosyltransferase involved in cell wall biosynthesis
VRVGITTSVIQRGQTGIAQYVFALLRALIERGTHEYTLFVLEEDLKLFEFASSKVEIVKIEERYRSPCNDILWHQMVLPGLARILRLDLLHVPSYRRMIWSAPCPLMATIHDLAVFSVQAKYDWKRMFYGRVVAARLARRQSRILAISENTARDIVRFFKIPRDLLSVVHSGLDHKRFFPSDVVTAKRFCAEKLRLDQPFFLYVSRLEHPAKNHVRLIEAFDRFKAVTGLPWLLTLAGEDWHGASAIHQAIQNSPNAKDIRCIGFVNDALLPELYRAAEVFVYPSLYEGFGMPPLEAMACGCPAISSTRGSLGEVVGNAAAVVEPEDINSLSSQMCAVSTAPAVREQMREAGLAQAKRFDWTQTAAGTVEAYERAATRH